MLGAYLISYKKEHHPKYTSEIEAMMTSNVKSAGMPTC